jgi:hypothetical protein
MDVKSIRNLVVGAVAVIASIFEPHMAYSLTAIAIAYMWIHRPVPK